MNKKQYVGILLIGLGALMIVANALEYWAYTFVETEPIGEFSFSFLIPLGIGLFLLVKDKLRFNIGK